MCMCLCVLLSLSACVYFLPCSRMFIMLNNHLHGCIMSHLCVTDQLLNTSNLHGSTSGWVHVLVNVQTWVCDSGCPSHVCLDRGRSFAIASVFHFCGVEWVVATFAPLYLYVYSTGLILCNIGKSFGEWQRNRRRVKEVKPSQFIRGKLQWILSTHCSVHITLR